jgi:hypothetical protein
MWWRLEEILAQTRDAACDSGISKYTHIQVQGDTDYCRVISGARENGLE